MARVFLAFAFAYFFSALLRAVTATLAPVFSVELGLGAGALGLLAGAYFLGFSALQLPLGSALDRFGPKRVLMVLLAVAVLGCAGFGAARDLPQLLAARFLIGMGVSACLMAPLTSYRRRFGPTAQLRANSWMLMTGSLGMLSSTLPVQWLLPVLGWRGLFIAIAGLLLLAIAAIAWFVPGDEPPAAPAAAPASGGYRDVFRHPAFVRMAPFGFFVYGGMVAMQSLWIGPWLTQVAGHTAAEAARGLFVVNLSMLVAFLCWGLCMPRLVRAGWDAERIIGVGWPLGIVCLAANLWLGPSAAAIAWSAWCVLTSVVSLSQPAVAQAFPASLAGRALSAFNLVIFLGVFAVQWGIGLLLDVLRGLGWSPLQSYRLAFGLFFAACLTSFLWHVWHRSRSTWDAGGARG
ncbi:MFS transporter [Aquabacterium humicola]|uniref:MFS transporter n=1 Tax=Aquabacterium humicola TaxID=3237377 RepID=UPI0025439931|nr:MFS transporter [Rubrivivax pictus]